MNKPAARRTKASRSEARRRTELRASVRGSRAKKVSVTIDEGILKQVQEDARKAGDNLSAYVTQALTRDLRRRRLQGLIAEYEAEHGSIDEEELRRVRSQWRD